MVFAALRKREVRPHRFVPCKRVVPPLHCRRWLWLRTPLTELIGMVSGADRDELGGRCPAGVEATANAGGLGILASATRRWTSWRRRSQGQGVTDKPFRVNIRAGRRGRPRRVDKCVGADRVSASQRLIARLKAGAVVLTVNPGRGQTCRARWQPGALKRVSCG